MKLTRRQLVAAAAGSAAATRAIAQIPAAGSAGRDFAKEARDAAQRNSDALAKFEVPVSIEPAFQFKA